MNKFTKAAIALVTAGALALTGCGNNERDGDGSTDDLSLIHI